MRRLGFTKSNLNLNGDNAFPELGSMFKAVHVKMILWYLTVKSNELAEAFDVTWSTLDKKCVVLLRNLFFQELP